MPDPDDVITIETEVPNPRYERLEAFRDEVRDRTGPQRRALNRAATLLLGDLVWSGSEEAESFGEDLDGWKTDLPGEFDGLVEDIEARMAQVPETTTETVEV